ncbi:MAG: hypothetical protein SV760_08955 [Halobacteria archaeon]|nr:hypothetical protein [Halobacteria archaeon]
MTELEEPTETVEVELTYKSISELRDFIEEFKEFDPESREPSVSETVNALIIEHDELIFDHVDKHLD